MATTVPVIETGGSTYFPPGAAVVIGGSGGIGRVICERLAQHGTDVALSYRTSADAAAEACGSIEGAGRRSVCAPVDLRDGTAVREFFELVGSTLGRIHTAVFAAGVDIPMVHVGAIEDRDWCRTLSGELTGFYHVMKAALPLMRDHGGSLIAVTSAGVRRHPPRDVLSTVPKAGVEALIRAVAREEGRFGIRANAVALGVVDAGHFHRVEEQLTPEFVAAIKRNTAVRRLGTAREAADAVVFLASSASSYTTGQSLAVDGGYST
jgi:NAD(P)-dependent dehydrogenase (short-subunit alcohol dehydrogenase family)